MQFDSLTGTARLLISILFEDLDAEPFDDSGEPNYEALGYENSYDMADSRFKEAWKLVQTHVSGTSWPPGDSARAIRHAFELSKVPGPGVVEKASNDLERKARKALDEHGVKNGSLNPLDKESVEVLEFDAGPERVTTRCAPELDVYQFDFEHGSMQLSTEVVEWIISMYVRDGSGLSKSDVAQKLMLDEGIEIDTSQLRDLLKSLGVKKGSPAVAPHRLECEEPEMVAQTALEREAASMSKNKAESEAEFYRSQYEEAQEELDATESKFEAVVKEAEIKSKTSLLDGPGYSSSRKGMAARTLLVLLSDFHIGKEVDGVCGNIFDVKTARKRASRLVQRMQERFEYVDVPVKRVQILGLGDFIDGPLADMFAQQHRGQDVEGYSQVVEASSIFSDVITEISRGVFPHTPTEIDCVPGNHGRSTSDHASDPYRLPEMLMYRLAQEMTPESAGRWNIHKTRRYERKEIEGVDLFMGHGDDGPRNVEDLQRTSDADDVLVCHGHSHETEIRGALDGRALVAQNGCLVGATDLDEDAICRRIRPSQKTMWIHPDNGPIEGPTIQVPS